MWCDLVDCNLTEKCSTVKSIAQQIISKTLLENILHKCFDVFDSMHVI